MYISAKMAANSLNETDALEDIELDTLMSLLGDGSTFPDDNGCGLSINDSGTTFDSLDDIMEFHDCFDNLPNDFDDISQFTGDTSMMIEPANTIVPVPSNVPATIVPATDTIVPTNVPVPTSAPGTIVPPDIDLGLIVQSTNQLLLNAILSRSIDLSQLSHPNMADMVAMEPQVDMHNLQQCVQHDHTYVGSSRADLGGVKSDAVKEGDTSGDKSSSDIEEGSSSDTGKAD